MVSSGFVRLVPWRRERKTRARDASTTESEACEVRLELIDVVSNHLISYGAKTSTCTVYHLGI